jgi:DNA repair exonuclease SbcCD ATPase subunit/DNA repair exonuclease SbcCD nuclease subunit
MTRIAQIGDTHLRNLHYHDEYRQVFSQIYDTLRNERVDYIVHCGDVVHSKTEISPELVEMVSDFFKNLCSIAPTVVILGNHDVNLKNTSRQDALSPIIKALELDNLFFFPNSQEFNLTKDITLNIFGITDEENWKKPTNLDKINIALYHGCISGVSTDIGYVLDKGDHDSSIFEGFDYAFLGDIHKTNQIVDTEGRVRYSGSTIQQNHGETDDKGILIWDIYSKESFNCKHFAYKHPKPFITITLNEDGSVPEQDINPGARIRILAENNISVDKVKKATDIVKTTYKPESVSFVNKATALKKQHGDDGLGSNNENLRDISVQEGLIKEYLASYKVPEQTLQTIFEINKRFSTTLDENEEIARNINWKLKKFEWDNLFNYGEGNTLDFSKLEGVVSLLGKNYSGKSSVVEGINYTLFNTTSKNNRKNLNVINQSEQKCRGRMEIEINGEDFIVERTSEKYTKKSKGAEITEAKTNVNFTSDSESLNGLDRSDTDKNIRRFFGTVDDFFLTSMASQFGSLSFISEGSTNRKQILAKFLDLENFEKKFKLAKEESSEIKAVLKKLEIFDYLKEIEDTKSKNFEISTDVINEGEFLNKSKDTLIDAKIKLSNIVNKINSVPTEIIDFERFSSLLKTLEVKVNTLNIENITSAEENNKLAVLISKIEDALKTLDIEESSKKEIELNQLRQEISKLEKEVLKTNTDIQNHNKKLSILQKVPCGPEFSSCQFIKDAYASKQVIDSLTQDSLDVNNILLQKTSDFNKLDSDVSEKIKKIEDLRNKKSLATQKLLSNETKIAKNEVVIQKTEQEILTCKEKIKNYIDNKDAIENLKENLKIKQEIESEIKKLSLEIEETEKTLNSLYRKQGSFEEKILLLEKQKEELDNTRERYAAYDLYQKCMHPSGISYEIIKKKLPQINEEISKILSNIADFNIYLENDDDKLDIIIKHHGSDPRPLEVGSGAEKTIASIAIRLAFLSVSTLPKSDFIIFDEPGTSLDSENIQAFIKILDVVKSYFKTVILISHLEILKECADTQITIEKQDNYAYINL